jgi:nucleotide-binding universal stress UspA family protein
MMYRTILVPLDGSPLAERALPYAQSLAHASDARLLLVRAVPPTRLPGQERMEDRAQAMRDAEEYLASLFPNATDDSYIVTAACFGEAATTIVEEAHRRQVNLIVMASDHRVGRRRWLYSSVTDQVFRHTDTPVFVIPSMCERPWRHDHTARILK